VGQGREPDSEQQLAEIPAPSSTSSGPVALDLYPERLWAEMEDLKSDDLDAVATGVYAVGGAADQSAYETAVNASSTA
jgi:glutathionyl-hydroquinone reductase